jgi:hypothetical protein
MARVQNDTMKVLKGNLKLALPTFVQVDGVNSGNPTLQLSADSTPATGEEVAFLMIIPKSYPGFPQSSLANATNADGGPSTVQLALETSASANISVWTTAHLLQVMHEVARANMDLEVYLRANGAIPTVADITAANLKVTIPSDVRHPNSGM